MPVPDTPYMLALKKRQVQHKRHKDNKPKTRVTYLPLILFIHLSIPPFCLFLQTSNKKLALKKK